MFCPNCGTQVEDGVKFCPSCGADLSGEEAAAETNNSESSETQQAETYTDYNSNTQAVNDANFGGSVTSRSIALCIILSLITCGIYSLYWLYVLNEDINSLSGDTNATGGGMVILFSIITCGIYELYWFYKMGEKIDMIKSRKGMNSSSSNILFLVLGIIGLGIVNYVIMQDGINKAVE